MNSGRILVVDDDARHADSLVDVLQASGHEVLRADSGQDAIATLSRVEHVDVILLDLNMPGLDGYDVLSRTRMLDPPPKVIVVSGEDRRDALRRLLQLGAFDYLPKPYALDDLLRSLDAALRQQRSDADAGVIMERIRQSDRLHRFLVDQSPDVIYMLDEDERFIFVSASAEQVFGRARDALIGRHWSVLFGTQELNTPRHHFNERRTGHRATSNLELQLPHAEGEDERWVEISATGLYRQDQEQDGEFSGTYGVARDISDRKRFSMALARSQRRFETLFHSSPDAVAISDARSGRILERNAHYVDLASRFGQTDDDDWLWSDDSARAALLGELRSSGGTVGRELQLRHPDGGDRVLAVSARLLALEARESVMMTLRDVTADREREAERLRMESQLHQARRLEAIGQLAGGIAHDFNNILASMIGFAELARTTLGKQAADASRSDEYLQEVVSAGGRARDLIAQLLNFTRTDHGEAVRVDLHAEADSVVRMLRSVMPTSIVIRNQRAAEHAPVLIDPVQLHQVIINLFINARDAIATDGTIDIGVADTHLDSALHCASCHEEFDGDYVCLEVSDDGDGIPEEIRDTLFDRLVTTRPGGRGTGFGLALIHSILHQHHGHVTLSSAPGTGTTFRLYLPVADAEVTPSPVAAEPLRAPVRPQTDAHVVVIDDEVSVANFLSEVLEHAGYRVTLFNDPGTALDYLLTHMADVSVVITDQTMPKLTGSELAQRLQAHDHAPPVILCTGYGNAVSPTEQMDGVRALLSKPFSIDALLEEVAQAHAAP